MSNYIRIAPDPELVPYYQWFAPNRSFYVSFRMWLKDTGCGKSTITIYGVGARLVFSYLDKPYWRINPDHDLGQVSEFIKNKYSSQATSSGYIKGVNKLGEYIRLRLHLPPKEKLINWDNYVGPLPDWMAELVRDYVHHKHIATHQEKRHKRIIETLSHLTVPLRWMVANFEINSIADLIPSLWFKYVEFRIASGLKPSTVNGNLHRFRGWLFYLNDLGYPVSSQMLRVDYLPEHKPVPKDLPIGDLKKLLGAIQDDIQSSHGYTRRLSTMDLAWFLLMIHSGLRTGEVRLLKLKDIDWERRFVRIEESKSLNDRIVPVSQPTIDALKSYLEIRGPSDALPENVFIFRHAPFSTGYCSQRLKTYGKRCGVTARPHQLRHSCATLLLNSGAPVLMVKTILGHKYIDTTMKYARLYDGRVAADYYQAMDEIESSMAVDENDRMNSSDISEILALLDSLSSSSLNTNQAESIQALRIRIQAIIMSRNQQ